MRDTYQDLFAELYALDEMSSNLIAIVLTVDAAGRQVRVSDLRYFLKDEKCLLLVCARLIIRLIELAY